MEYIIMLCHKLALLVLILGLFLAAFEAVSHQGQIAVDVLKRLGVHVSPDFHQVTSDLSKFYLRQQQKAVQNTTTNENTS